jgi:type I restriction enzyme M protein
VRGEVLVTDTIRDTEDVVSAEPRRRGRRKAQEPLTSKEQLSKIIKSARDLLRTDAGLYGDTDRLPQLTWMLFLKLLNDQEIAAEIVKGNEYEPVIDPPYRWRDWAATGERANRLTGDELIAFVNNDLIPYLSRLSGTDSRDIRTIVGTVFQGTVNRVRSGYILREVVDKISQINFNSSDDIHTISHFYESMLREMRDAAGDAGEFYTPRPVVRLIVDRLAPRLGERILDPACGTCGFLVEAFDHLKDEARDPVQREGLETDIIGTEKKSTPYLLGVMNLLLHGIERPNVVERNALQKSLRDVKDSDRVDVIATNPPFGGEEEPGILNNFPEGMRTKETAILFVQHVMAMLKRPGGRCGIVLPNGFLFGEGVATEVKKRLLERFNLHTIVRLPNGVFAPYTSIATNILFFEACSLEHQGMGTKEIWYYEQPLPEGRKNYSKTQPLQWEELSDLREWWANREENERAWRVPVDQIVQSGYNLDLKNPDSAEVLERRSPEELIESIIEKEQIVLEIMGEIREMLGARVV